MKRSLFTPIFILFSALWSFAQVKHSTIQGKIKDLANQEALVGVNVHIENSSPIIGATTDTEGKFLLKDVPFGRYTLVISYVGYKKKKIHEVLAVTEKPLSLEVQLERNPIELEGITVESSFSKAPGNTMATLSGRSFTIEESSRFAGGLSDPSRVVYNFAGVTFSSPQDNGVIVRGNSPTSVLWKVNGLDVMGASHFGGGNMAGAGLISIYSAQVLRSTDFFTGAFPAEYTNATSGVFDINFRKGDKERHHFTSKLGIIGVDLGAEGPIGKEQESSYLVNYRHGFIGYIGKLSGGVEPHFQDLSFNLNFPTKNWGDFSFWGMGGLSSNVKPYKKYQKKEKDGKLKKEKFREYENDFLDKDIQFGMGATGLNHYLSLGENAHLNTVVGCTKNYYDNDVQFFEDKEEKSNDGKLFDYKKQRDVTESFSASTHLYSQLGKRITNRTGVQADYLTIEALSWASPDPKQLMEEQYELSGKTYSLRAYSQFGIELSRGLKLNVGLATTRFGKNDEAIWEPRLGLKWQVFPFMDLSLAFGEHSKREDLKTYFYLNPKTGLPNELNLSKAKHYVGALNFRLGEHARFTAEVYYQDLYDIPVIEGTTYSFANYTQLWKLNGPISNKGTGINKGVDLTLERSMNNGWYYLLSCSLYDSEYTDAQGKIHNTLFDRRFMSTLTFGKEFVVKGKNLLGFNANVSYLGGIRRTPYLEQESLAAKKVILDETRLYEEQADPELWVNFGVTYKINKKNSVRTWGFDFQNATLTAQKRGYAYNVRNQAIDVDEVLFILPNFYYKIEF
ncbi:MAG: TonB-dependent receptor [Cytophagales bacterium]|nr:TonB-dependent receptor [Cytophagales bacterium]